MVGASGFEPPASWSRTRRASQAALRPDGRHPGAIKPARVGYQNSIARCLYLEFGTMAQRIIADCPVTVRDRLNREPRATAQRRSPESQTRPVTLQALHIFIYCLPRRTQIDFGALLSNRPHGSDDTERNGIALSRARMDLHRSGHILDCVACGNLKQ